LAVAGSFLTSTFLCLGWTSRTEGIAGNNLTRDNINSIALNLRNLELGLLLPGVKINTFPTQKHLIVDQILTRFDGVRFMPIE
jgi:hypothetical protein